MEQEPFKAIFLSSSSQQRRDRIASNPTTFQTFSPLSDSKGGIIVHSGPVFWNIKVQWPPMRTLLSSRYQVSVIISEGELWFATHDFRGWSDWRWTPMPSYFTVQWGLDPPLSNGLSQICCCPFTRSSSLSILLSLSIYPCPTNGRTWCGVVACSFVGGGGVVAILQVELVKEMKKEILHEQRNQGHHARIVRVQSKSSQTVKMARQWLALIPRYLISSFDKGQIFRQAGNFRRGVGATREVHLGGELTCM